MNEFLIYLLQSVFGILFVITAWVFRSLFSRLDSQAKRINALEIASARTVSENATLFKRLDGIESKLDRLLENWRRDPR